LKYTLISNKDIKPRSAPQKVAFIAFRFLGIVAIFLSSASIWEVDEQLFYFGLTIWLMGIPLIILGVILGPGLSLIVGWNDRNLMLMTGISILLVVLLGVLDELDVTPSLQDFVFVCLLLAYGLSCLTIGAKWLTKTTG
jgi:hypothetical protein